MLTEPFKLTFAIFLPFITGYLLVSLLSIKEKSDYVLKVGLAYGMGTGILAVLMMLLGAFHIPYTQINITSALLIVFCLFLALFLSKAKKNSFNSNNEIIIKSPPEPISWSIILLRIILFITITINLFFVFFRAANLPVISWDGMATVAFKAKIFYFEGYLPHMNKLPHSTYPHLVPFNEAWIAFNLGYWSEEMIKIIFPFALLSFLLIIFAFLKRLTNKTWALIGCTILLSSNLLVFHATISYRDFFLMYYNCAVIMLLVLWNKEEKNWLLWVGSFFAGFATFTKLEGTAFILIYLFLFCLLNYLKKNLPWKKKFINFVKFSIPAFFILIPFHLYKIFHGVLQDGVGANDKTALNLSLANLKLIPDVLKAFTLNMFFSGNWGIAWAVLLLSLIQLKNKKISNEIKVLGLSTILFLALYGAVAIFTHNYVWIAGEKGEAGLSRLLLHFFPLTILLIILLNYPYKKTE